PPANDSYCPDEYVKRDQMASFLGRALSLEENVPPPPTTTSSTSPSTSTTNTGSSTTSSTTTTVPVDPDVAWSCSDEILGFWSCSGNIDKTDSSSESWSCSDEILGFWSCSGNIDKTDSS